MKSQHLARGMYASTFVHVRVLTTSAGGQSVSDDPRKPEDELKRLTVLVDVTEARAVAKDAVEIVHLFRGMRRRNRTALLSHQRRIQVAGLGLGRAECRTRDTERAGTGWLTDRKPRKKRA